MYGKRRIISKHTTLLRNLDNIIRRVTFVLIYRGYGRSVVITPTFRAAIVCVMFGNDIIFRLYVIYVYIEQCCYVGIGMVSSHNEIECQNQLLVKRHPWYCLLQFCESLVVNLDSLVQSIVKELLIENFIYGSKHLKDSLNFVL